jgi:uncharacterized protein YndB with AHSA1/START domain
MKVRESIYIETGPAKIWPYLTEPIKILEWHTTFHSYKYTSKKPIGTGSTFCAEEKMPGHYITIDYKITAWVPNKKFAFSIIAEDVNRKYEQIWSIEPALSGCNLTVVENVQFPYQLYGRILGFISRFGSKSSKKKMLRRLKHLLEA